MHMHIEENAPLNRTHSKSFVSEVQHALKLSAHLSWILRDDREEDDETVVEDD